MSPLKPAARSLLVGAVFLAGLSACKRPAEVPSTQPASLPGEANAAQANLSRTVTPPAVLVQASAIHRRADGCLDSAPDVPKAPPPPRALSGRLGLWVAEIDPQTLQPIRAVGTNPDSVFPLASTYKQAVLWALLKAFDQGRITPTERFDITRQNQSLGAYPFDGMNVKDLSVRMIQYSDNTATDILHRRIGLQTVQDTADQFGLCHTRLILPTRDWWASEAGLSGTFNGTKRWAAARGQERTRLAGLIDLDAQRYRADYIQHKLDDYLDHRYDPQDDLRVHNISTPYEFATLLAEMYLRPGLSVRALKWQREVAAKGFGQSALRAQQAGNVESFYGKGGNGWRILTYTGYFKTRDGKHVVYAFMQHGADQTYTMPNTRRAFAWINAGIDAVIGKQAPKPTLKPLPQSSPAPSPQQDTKKLTAKQGG